MTDPDFLVRGVPGCLGVDGASIRTFFDDEVESALAEIPDSLSTIRKRIIPTCMFRLNKIKCTRDKRVMSKGKIMKKMGGVDKINAMLLSELFLFLHTSFTHTHSPPPQGEAAVRKE
jgi:hypothetical protein